MYDFHDKQGKKGNNNIRIISSVFNILNFVLLMKSFLLFFFNKEAAR